MSGLDEKQGAARDTSESANAAENEEAAPAAADGSADEAPAREEKAAKRGAGAKAEKSPRLKKPRHHRIVRPGAGARRRMITLAGMMLVLSSALGAYTAVGVLGQIGSNPPASIPQTPMNISGFVVDNATNEPLSGVTVVVVGSVGQGATNEDVTNAEGWYYLDPVAPGTYTLEASKAGFKTVRKTINVGPAIPRLEGFTMVAGDGVQEFPPEPVGHYSDPRGPQLALGVAILLSSLLSIIGGWSAITHRHYLTAVAGAAGGTATVGLVGGIPLGTLLAVAALAILASLKTGFLEAQKHRIPWEEKSPLNRRGGRRNR